MATPVVIQMCHAHYLLTAVPSVNVEASDANFKAELLRRLGQTLHDVPIEILIDDSLTPGHSSIQAGAQFGPAGNTQDVIRITRQSLSELVKHHSIWLVYNE